MVGVGLVAEVLAWLSGQLETHVEAEALWLAVRAVYHAGRVEALEAAAQALEESGYPEAARALRVAAGDARGQLEEALALLSSYDTVADSVRHALKSRAEARQAQLQAAGAPPA